MRKILLASLMFTSFSVCAQNEIYKCVDDNGNIIYANDSKSGTCQKTTLSTIDKGNTVNKVLSNENPIAVREQKRTQILQGELSQEKSQLQSISEMLKNTQDDEQKKKLLDMESMHKRNVNALQKELGAKANVELLIPGSIGHSTTGGTLPISLPNEDKKADGIITQIMGIFKSNSKKDKGNQENQQLQKPQPPTTVEPTQIKEEQPKVIINEPTIEEPQRVKLETNLITNKSLKR